jgi:lipopolysaccharide export system protein LptA
MDHALLTTPLRSLLLRAAYLGGIALVSLFALGVAHAEKADRDRPMNIEADALKFDDQKQINVFTGKVLITKGTLVLRGHRIEVRQDAQGNQFGTVVGEPGQRAFYRQKRDGVDEFIEGEAETIEYDGQADVVRFVQRAEMRRYKGAVLNDQMTGRVIAFNNATAVYTVDGHAAQGDAPAGRVRAMLTPGTAQPAVLPGAVASPAVLKPATATQVERR